MIPRAQLRILSAAVFLTAALSFAQTEPIPQEPTAAECENFGKQIAEDIGHGDQDAFFKCVDLSVLGTRVIKGFTLSADEEEGMRSGLAIGVKKSLTDIFGEHATADYIRTLKNSGEQRVLIRLLTKTGGFNYLAFTVIKSADGQVRYIDRFDFMTANLLSEGIHEIMLTLWGDKLTNSADKKYNQSEMWPMYQQLKMLNNARFFLKAGNYDAALKAFARFPDEIQWSKAVLKMRLQALQKNPDSPEYMRVLEEWESHHPNDPSLSMILIEANFIRKEYAEAAKNIDALAKSLGGTDGHLCRMKATLLNLDHSREDAKKAAREGIEAEPAMLDNYQLLQTLCLESLDYAGLADTLTLIETNFPSFDMDRTIRDKHEYDNFRDSDAYQAWIKARTALHRN